MLLSNSRRFIFIKTRKTAGTTLEILLSPYCDRSDDIVTPLVPEDEAMRRARTTVGPRNYRFTARDWIGLPAMVSRQRRLLRHFDRRLFTQRFWNHVDGRIVRARVTPEQWRYLRFCVERDPWDKMISAYYYLADYLGHDVATWTFRDFFDDGWAEWLSDFTKYNADGDFIVDRVINFDRLAEALALIAPDLGIEEPLDTMLAGISAKKGKAGRKKPAGELFEPDLEQRGRRIFAREIESFGFRNSPHAPRDRKDPFLFTNGRTVN